MGKSENGELARAEATQKTIFQTPNDRVVRVLAKDAEERLGKEDWKRICAFADEFVDRLAYELVRLSKGRDADGRANEKRRWLVREARDLRALVSGMPGFAKELGGIPQTELAGHEEADWANLEEDLFPWLESVLSVTVQILSWQLGEAPHLENLKLLLSRATELQLQDVDRSEEFKRRLKNERHLIAEHLLPEVETDGWAVFVSPARRCPEPAANSTAGAVGPYTPIIDGGWSSHWTHLAVELRSLDDVYVSAAKTAAAEIYRKARISWTPDVSVGLSFRLEPSDAAMAWWRERSQGWAWHESLHWRSVEAHVKRTLEVFGALTTLALPDHDVYFGAIDAFAGLINYRSDRDPEVDAVEARFEEMWLPLEPHALLSGLLGTAEVTRLGLRRIFSDLHVDTTDATSATGRLRRALVFWSRAERIRWDIKRQARSVYAIGDAITSYFRALEVVMGDNDHGAVVERLSRRAATVMCDDAEGRLEAVKHVRDLYHLRSRYVHAGQVSARGKELEQTRLVARVGLLDFIRWIACSGANAGDGAAEEENDAFLHRDYIKRCDSRGFGA